ncbi:HlyD family secretion protein [Photobacterium sp. CCB-ST2H9]|uniref:HlyD family secretion protein n=1 Tax=Photobacterium sp. CCB-ST2H9 TaxID=2912855 RepID=UPI002004B5B9|nr:HlyD family efflux transporter periplasmic adaptor subunit [Photobacterium sp. CCB-ST2H9]UTM59673.1 HlyD family secretion protein [Photobacterium sp. CCB-ST2H9]
MGLDNKQESLFRPEVFENEQYRLCGTINLANSHKTRYIFVVVLILFISILFYVLSFDYSRKTVVHGMIESSSGIIRVEPRYNGVVNKIYIREGDLVNNGDNLFSIVSEDYYDDTSYLSLLLFELKLQEGNLKNEIKRNQELLLNFKKLIKVKLETARTEKLYFESRITQLNEQLINKEEIIKSSYELLQDGLENSLDHYILIDELIELKLRIEESNFALRSWQSKISNIEIESSDYEIKNRKNENIILNQLSDVKKEILKLKNSGEKIIKATKKGLVSSVNINVGDYIDEASSLAMIIPYGSKLIAELEINTQSSAFIENGDTVQLQIDAFPYQTFGFIYGKIYYVSDAVHFKKLESSSEPYYISRVMIDKPYLVINSQKVYLKRGMKVKADIIHEKKTVFKWIIDNFSSIRFDKN